MQPKSFESLKPYVSTIKAMWQGYLMRKLFLHLLRQSKPNHLYFSKGEVHETLSKKTLSPTKHYGCHNYKQGGFYIGEWLGGFRHGYGAMVWPDGAKYEGYWSFSRASGFGKFIHVDGEIFNGKWTKYWVSPRDTFGSAGNFENLKDSANDGFLWLWAKQEIFRTELPKQKVLSKVRKINKEISNQSFKNVKSKTEKIIRRMNELKNSFCVEGNKILEEHKYENGVVYTGNWKNKKKDGFGKQTWTNGDVYEGFWSEDKQHGVGKHIWSTGNIYFGEFVNDQKEGVGEYRWCDKSVYIGEWQKNKMHGVGKHKWEDGKEYIGEWVNGAREGFGQMIYKNGSKYEGEFTYDRPHGYGVLVEAEGRVLKGLWENGKFVEPIFM